MVDTRAAAPMNVMGESIMGQLKLAFENTSGQGALGEKLTDSDAAGGSAEKTGIDLLAVSVGTEHGTAYADKKAEVDMDRLKAIFRCPRRFTAASGVSHDKLRRLRENGVGKMNIGGAIRIGLHRSTYGCPEPKPAYGNARSGGRWRRRPSTGHPPKKPAAPVCSPPASPCRFSGNAHQS